MSRSTVHWNIYITIYMFTMNHAVMPHRLILIGSWLFRIFHRKYTIIILSKLIHVLVSYREIIDKLFLEKNMRCWRTPIQFLLLFWFEFLFFFFRFVEAIVHGQMVRSPCGGYNNWLNRKFSVTIPASGKKIGADQCGPAKGNR